MAKDKSPIKLREKPLTNGNKSLYLDTYQKGVRSFEFLHLYIIPERTLMDRERNKTTRMQAEVIRAKRILELQENNTKVRTQRTQYKGMLSEFIREVAKEKQGRCASNYKGVAFRVEKYGDSQLRQIDEEYLLRLCRNMLPRYAPNTIRATFDVIHSVLRKAEQEGYVFKNPVRLKELKLPRRVNKYDNYLTFEQVEKLMHFKHKSPRRQRAHQAFLFACFTGLRMSDVMSLRYNEIVTAEDGTKYIDKVQQKTKERVRVPLSANALSCIPVGRIKPKENEKVFIMGNRAVRSMLKANQEYLGTSKRITFHTSRHTFATMLISYGADIYTVSKLLGHTNIMTTRIYAEVTSRKREEAINAIPNLT